MKKTRRRTNSSGKHPRRDSIARDRYMRASTNKTSNHRRAALRRRYGVLRSGPWKIANMTVSIETDKPLNQAFWDLFVGRNDDFAEQYRDIQTGEIKYRRVGRPLTMDDVQAHLDGVSTYGLYAIDPADQSVNWIVWDIDCKDECPAVGGRSVALESLKPQVTRIIDAIKRHAFPEKAVLVEFSGSRGYHVWLFLNPPIPAVVGYFIGRKIAEEAGLDCEVFPKQRELLSPFGGLVKAPLGLHRRTNNRCELLDWKDWRSLDAGVIRNVEPAFLAVDEEMKRRITYETKPWFAAMSTVVAVKPYVGEDPPCVRNYLSGMPMSIGHRHAVFHRIGNYYLHFKGLRGTEEGIGQVRHILHEWNSHNSPPLESARFEEEWKGLLSETKYNYGCHDEYWSRTCDVAKCPLMKSKAPVLFGEFDEETLKKAEELSASPDLLSRFIQVTNRWVIRDEAIRRNILRVCVSAFCEQPINHALFGRDSIGKSYNAIHVARLLDDRGSHIWFLGGISPTSFIYDFGEYDKTRKAWIADLNGITMLFLEPPHPETWAKLKPVLSHDKKEIMFKVTQKSKGGQLRTLRCIVRGWPAVIQCAAESGYRGGEYSSRFLTGTPEISKDKTKEGMGKLGEMMETPGKYGFDTEEVKAWSAAYELLSKEFPIKVRIPYGKIIAEHFVVRGPETMRVLAMFGRLIMANTALHFKQRQKDEEGYCLAKVEDFQQVLDDFEKIAAPTFLGLSGDTLTLYKELAGKMGLTYEQIEEVARQTFGAETSEATLRKLYIRRLVEVGLLKEKQHPEDKRRMLYDAVETSPEIKAFDDREAVIEGIKRKIVVETEGGHPGPENATEYPPTVSTTILDKTREREGLRQPATKPEPIEPLEPLKFLRKERKDGELE